jgi:4'-phosphopantetheinyl transferase
VSHTDRVLLVAIGDSPIGLDVARVEECSEFPALEAQLTDPELHRLRRVAPSHRQEVLAEFWTRKEAVLKAVGCGLRFPLSALDVTQPIVQSAELSGELRWRVMTARLDAEHVWSLAVSDDTGTSQSAEVVNLSSTMAILHEQLANAEAGDT